MPPYIDSKYTECLTIGMLSCQVYIYVRPSIINCIYYRKDISGTTLMPIATWLYIDIYRYDFLCVYVCVNI